MTLLHQRYYTKVYAGNSVVALTAFAILQRESYTTRTDKVAEQKGQKPFEVSKIIIFSTFHTFSVN